MLPNIGAPELIIILIIALLIVGPGKLPDVGAALGKSIREFRKAATDVKDSTKVEVDTSPLPRDRSGDVRRSGCARRSGRRPSHRPLAPLAVAPMPPVAAPVDAAPRRARCDGTTVGLADRATLAAGLALTVHGRRRRPARAGCPGLPSTPESGRPPPRRPTPGDEAEMSLVDHLAELRTGSSRSILAVAVGSAVGFYFAARIRNS